MDLLIAMARAREEVMEARVMEARARDAREEASLVSPASIIHTGLIYLLVGLIIIILLGRGDGGSLDNLCTRN